jgi:hypothetical protein
VKKPDAPKGEEITLLLDTGNFICGAYDPRRFRRHILVGDWRIAASKISGWVPGCERPDDQGHDHG